MENVVIERVKLLSKTMNLSENAFANRINMPQTTVSAWLNYRRKPQMEFVNAILSTFESVSAEWLLRGEGEMFKGENVSTTNGNGNNVVNGNGNSNINQSQGSGMGMSLYRKLVKVIMRGCPTEEEQDKMIDELEKYMQE